MIYVLVTQFSNLYFLCMRSGNFAICTNISLILSSIILGRYPVTHQGQEENHQENPYSKRRLVTEILAHLFHRSHVP